MTALVVTAEDSFWLGNNLGFEMADRLTSNPSAWFVNRFENGEVSLWV